MQGILIFISLVLQYQVSYSTHELEKNPPNTAILKYPFEGVDLDNVPLEHLIEETDCYNFFLECLRYRTNLNVVCGYSTKSGDLENFMNICQLEFMNCEHRGTPYGSNYKDNLISYNGEGFDCQHYVRLGGSPEEAVRLYLRSIPITLTDEEFMELKRKQVKALKEKALNTDIGLKENLPMASINERVVKEEKALKTNIDLKENLPMASIDGRVVEENSMDQVGISEDMPLKPILISSNPLAADHPKPISPSLTKDPLLNTLASK